MTDKQAVLDALERLPEGASLDGITEELRITAAIRLGCADVVGGHGSESQQGLKSQLSLSGGPPKPPKKTAKGLQDGAPEPNSQRLFSVVAKLVLTERLIDKISEDIRKPELSIEKRSEMQESLNELRHMQKKAQHQKKELQKQ